MPLRFALALVALAGPVALAPAVSGQTIRVDLDAPQHVFEGAGVSFGLFLGHHYSMGAAAQDLAVRWIAQDLNLTFLQDYPNGDRRPDVDVEYFDQRADYVKAVRAYRPGVEFALSVNILPQRLRQDTTINGRPYRILDTDDPEIYAKLADWYYELVRGFGDRGVSVEILNVVNEPDLVVCGDDPNQCRPYFYGYGDDTKRGVAEIFARAVPLFKAKFADPALNPTGMAVPRVMGPSTIAPGGGRDGGGTDGAIDYLRYFKTVRPDAWEQIDIVSTHQYINGMRGDLFQVLRGEADGKPIFQNETHASKEFGPSTLRAPHRTALSLARQIAAAVNYGTHMWAYFETNYPNPADPDDRDRFRAGGLMSTPWATNDPQRYKHYFVFRQLTSAQPDSSTVYRFSTSAGRTGDVLAFRKPGQDTLYVSVINLDGTAKPVVLGAEDAGGTYTLSSYTVRTTDATRDDDEVARADLTPGSTTMTYEIGPYSVNTFTVALGAVNPVSNEPTPDALAVTLLPTRPNPVRERTTIGYRLPAAGPVRLDVLDVLGRRVATLVDGPQRAGDHEVTYDASGLGAGVYLYRIQAGAAVASRWMTVVR